MRRRRRTGDFLCTYYLYFASSSDSTSSYRSSFSFLVVSMNFQVMIFSKMSILYGEKLIVTVTHILS
ncbi:hypothetical protein CSUI_008742 [Cystoisospora suis]|uniref:Uncharacterized protein n=1 Tax=Cystoisospora suis TaxID=483139 RepID=A0A2C6KLD2_9APIC|nr:hypothetical protein CSUI_008742 [Cystoisospora suis]